MSCRLWSCILDSEVSLSRFTSRGFLGEGRQERVGEHRAAMDSRIRAR